MSCKYYYMDGYDYHCGKCDKDVNSDWYYKYCRNYDYDDCPVYRGKMSEPAGDDSSGGCFLTSACTAARGLPDDCHELQTLRRFRDGWLKQQPEGIALIAHYYEVAPKIVAAIDAREDRLEIYEEMYRDLVLACVELIDAERYEEALALYRSAVLEYEGRYV